MANFKEGEGELKGFAGGEPCGFVTCEIDLCVCEAGDESLGSWLDGGANRVERRDGEAWR